MSGWPPGDDCRRGAGTCGGDRRDAVDPVSARPARRERPDACALACNSASADWLRVSWSRLAEDSRRAASGLRALGVGPGDHVALLLDNRSAYECFVATLGMLRRGAALVPLNTRSTAAELAYALGAADCRWLIAGAEAAERVERRGRRCRACGV